MSPPILCDLGREGNNGDGSAAAFFAAGFAAEAAFFAGAAFGAYKNNNSISILI